MEINSVSQGRQNDSNISNMVENIKDNLAEIAIKMPGSSHENKDSPVDERQVKDLVDGLNKLIKNADTHIEYERHDKFNQYMIKIINNETKEVIKEIPPKKILDMVAKMCEMIGIIVDKKA